MKRLLFVQPKLSGIGGIEKVIPIMAKEMSQKGHLVSTATFYGDILDTVSFIQYSHFEVSSPSLFQKIKKITSRIFWLYSVIKSDAPDVVVVSAHGAAIMVLLLRTFRFIAVPVVVYEHQSLKVSDFGYGVIRRFLYGQANGFVAVSNGLLAEIAEVYPMIPKALLYNPVVPSDIRSKKPERPVFVTASRLELVKGVDILVTLFLEYIKQGGQGELHVFGEGSQENSLRNQVTKNGLEHLIKFKGVTQSLENELKQVTAYISCAREEALGVSLIEALSTGTPIICLDVPYGPREVMNMDPALSLSYPHITDVGILYSNIKNTQPIEAFIQALSFVIENPDAFSDPAMKRADYFSTATAVQKFEDFINKISV